MGYTYDDFEKAAKNSGLYDAFTEEDLVTARNSPEFGLSMLKLYQDAGKANTQEQKLLVQEAVNQLRGVYGNKYGTQLDKFEDELMGVNIDGSFQYGREDQHKELLDKATTPGSFAFDPKTDPTYQDMKGSWTADGDRTAQRLLNMPGANAQSSFAGAAVQQGNNYYDARLNDQIPAVRQNAYQKHLSEFEKDGAMFDAVQADRNFDYAAYLQQKQLDATKAQQQFANELALKKEFGTQTSGMPDLDGMRLGEDTTYSYEGETEYQKALDAVTGQGEFQYDRAQDPLYASARKSYLREGDRALADTLAEKNAATGGVASSYGIRAALDAANQYNEGLNAEIPGLESTAYMEYIDDFERKLQGLGQLREDKATDYEGWLQEYQMKEQAKQQEFENAMSLYKALGHLTPGIAEVLGVPYTPPVAATVSGRKPNPDGETGDYTVEDVLDALVAGKTPDGKPAITAGYDRNTANGQKQISGAINGVINDAVSSGEITNAQAAELRKKYAVTSGGRYTY